MGPLRVLPGRLSVSRTFGDAEAKLEQYGGKPNVVIAEPEIKSFKIVRYLLRLIGRSVQTKARDFIIMGCDGIFDRLSNKEVLQCAWNSVNDNVSPNIHKMCGLSVEYVLKNSLLRRTLDNVTVVMIAFSNFKHIAIDERLGAEDVSRSEQNENVPPIAKSVTN